MKQIKKILCYVDPLHHAQSTVVQTIALAKLSNARVCFISVLQPITIPAPNLQETYIEIQKNALNKLLEETGGNNIESEVKVVLGSLGAIDVIRQAINQHYDLIIKPADYEAHSNLSIFGSNDQHLLRKCSLPVWINKPTKSFACKSLLVAVDVNPKQAANHDINQSIITWSHYLADTFGADIHIAHAWHLPYENLLRNSGSQKVINKLNDAMIELEKKHRLWWENFIKTQASDINPDNLHFINGNPDTAISELSKNLQTDTVIMGTVARTGISDFFIGNTAERLLAKLDCSVFAIKPSSFSCPVK